MLTLHFLSAAAGECVCVCVCARACVYHLPQGKLDAFSQMQGKAPPPVWGSQALVPTSKTLLELLYISLEKYHVSIGCYLRAMLIDYAYFSNLSPKRCIVSKVTVNILVKNRL